MTDNNILIQILVFIVCLPFAMILLTGEGDDDDNGPDDGLMQPAYIPTQ